MNKRIIFSIKTVLCLCLILLFQTTFLNAQSNEEIDNLISKYAKQNGLDKNLVKSIIEVSSGGNSKAESAGGAIGLMQLDPNLIKEMGVKNAFDPEQNIKAGCSYLKMLLQQFGDMELAVAAFNAGPSEVTKYGKVPPFPETTRFVSAVMQKYNSLKGEHGESNIYGYWVGTALYKKYESKPLTTPSVVGVTQPFDLEIIPIEGGVILKNSNKQMGDESLCKTKIEGNTLSVQYSGPNPFAVPIPNADIKQTMDYTLELEVTDNSMKGIFSVKIISKVHYNIPELNLPDSEAEIDYIMSLDLKKR